MSAVSGYYRPAERACPLLALQVEWVQWNLMLGVDHITVYLADTSFALPELLRPYMERGIVDVRLWVLPELLPHELLSQQVPLINDCLYRSLDRFEWVRLVLTGR